MLQFAPQCNTSAGKYCNQLVTERQQPLKTVTEDCLVAVMYIDQVQCIMQAAAAESSRARQWARRATVFRDWPVASLTLRCSASLALACRTLPSTSFAFAASCARCALALTILQRAQSPTRHS